MTRLFDFAFPTALQDFAQDCYSKFWEEIQEFAINTDSSLLDVLNMPHWVIDDYYQTKAWNIRKELNAENAKIHTRYSEILNNIIVGLKNIASR